MKTRFKKVWCGECCTMQFTGECGHGRAVAPAALLGFDAAVDERKIERLSDFERGACSIVDGFASRPCSTHGVIECPPCWRVWLRGSGVSRLPRVSSLNPAPTAALEVRRG